MLIRSLARSLIAGIFVYGGADAARDPDSKAGAAQKLMGDWTPPGVAETSMLVRLDGMAKVAAGVSFALGIRPRLSALAMAGSLVPTTLAGHRFWEESDPTQRKMQLLHLLKNAAIVGGLLYAITDKPKPISPD